MPISLDKIVTQTNSKIISGGQDAINTARLAGSVEALESRYSVANLAALPPAVDNTGRFIYVEDIEAYRYSDGTQWTNDYDTTLTATSGQLWAWGCNNNGHLGNGTTVNVCSPVREFCSAADWCQASAGIFHTAAIKTSGQLWSWGLNTCGRVGDGTSLSRCSPVREFCSATDWSQVSAGFGHTTALKTSGEIWSWGINTGGLLGDGTVTSSCSPVREFCSASDWCFVNTLYHTTAVKTSGQLWIWGTNRCGSLGDGTVTTRCSPVREFCSASNWCAASSGGFHTIAIKTSGEIWSWGRNNLYGVITIGVLGTGTSLNSCSPVREFCSATDWCSVSAGNCHSAAIKISGELWLWGNNAGGYLGTGPATQAHCSPVREFCSATDWCQVDSGFSHTAAVKTSGQLWAWGLSYRGRLGDGVDIAVRCSPVREFCSATDWCQVDSGFSHTVAVKVTRGFNEP